MESPQKIGKFRVLRLLGQGGMGRVFLAEDPLIDREVAIKVMTAGSDDEARKRFRNEARAAGQLSHPNIVPLHEFGCHNGQPYLVMEYLQGESLERWLARKQPLKARLSILLDLCQAIAHAHSRGVLHRDIKPANLQVLPDGVCKLMDFGIARSRSVRLTATGAILGTPAFLAPEVLQDAGYSTSSDVYAVSVLAYEVLGGANPFHAATLPGCMQRVLTYVPPPLAEVCPDVPAVLSDLISSYLSKTPEQRPADMKPLIGALQQLLDRPPHSADAPLAPRAPSAPIPPQPTAAEAPTVRGWTPHSRRLPAAALAAFLLAGLLSAAVLWQPWSEPARISEVAVTPPPPQGSPADSLLADRQTAGRSPGPPAAGATVPQARDPVDRTTGRQAAPESPQAPAPHTAEAQTPPAVDPPAADLRSKKKADPAAAGRLPKTESATGEAPTREPPAGKTLPDQAPVRVPPGVETAISGPSIDRLDPLVVRRGSTAVLHITGKGFAPETEVAIRRGGRPVRGLRILRTKIEGTSKLRVTLLVDRQLPLGTYAVTVVDGTGRESSSIGLEVGL